MQLVFLSFLAYTLVLLGVTLAQRRLIYPGARWGGGLGARWGPSPAAVRTPELSGATLEKIPGPRGHTVHAFYAPAPDGAPTVVHFHGNGEELADVVGLVALFRSQGFGVLAVEYPGYGLSRDREPSETALYEDAEAALDDLLEKKGIPRDRLVLSGQSLGTGVAVEMARRGYGARVVLLSPYTCVADVARRYLPFLPTRLLVRDAFDSASKAPAIRVPVLVVHGTDDEVISFALGKTLAGLFPNARLVPIARGGHNDLFEHPETLANITAFARDAH